MSSRWARALAAAAAWGTFAASGQALASGYALREQSPSAVGNAQAGAAAAAEDLSYLALNPASVTRLEGSQISMGGSYLAPRIRFRNGDSSSAGGTPFGGNRGGGDVGGDALVPSVYALWDVRQQFGLEENVKLGVGLNVPFGLQTDYRDGWLGRYYALDSRVDALTINPVVAYEALPGFSIAAGLQVQRLDARLTNAIDFGALSGVPGLVGQADGRGEVQGDDWSWGYNFGALYEPWKGTRFGATYRSEIEHDIEGRAHFDLDQLGIGQNIKGLTGAFSNTNAKTTVTTPQSVSFGAYHDIDEQWAVMGTAEWTGWSSFDELKIKYANSAQPDSLSEFDWNNTWFFALGVTYRPVEEWAIRSGVAWDQSPTTNANRSPRVPDSDRTWIALGASYRLAQNVALDASYAHIFFRNASIDQKSTDPGNQFRGNLSGDVESAADVFSLQARWTF